MNTNDHNLPAIGYYFDPSEKGFSKYGRHFPNALRLSSRLSRINRSRYRRRAEKLLDQGSLTIKRLGTVVFFDFEDKYVNMSISEDKGKNFQPFNGLPCVGTREEKIAILIDFFGRSSEIIWASHLPFLRKRN